MRFEKVFDSVGVKRHDDVIGLVGVLTPAEVRDVLLERVGNILEFTEKAEATEYRQSVSAWPGTEKSGIVP